jgi:exopolysaccharide biosynthesis polyprenyl glycosylphosphotransferase
VVADGRLLRAGLGAGVAMTSASVAIGGTLDAPVVATASLLATAATVGTRAGVARWLRTAGRQHALVRPVLVMTDERQASRLFELVAGETMTGWRLGGAVGPCEQAALRHGVAHFGPCTRATAAALASSATVVIASSAALHDECCHEALQALRASGLEVHVDPNLAGFDVRHLRMTAVGREPLLVLDQPRLRGIQRATKRGMDLALAATALVLASPLLLVAVVAIKLTDHGPVLFRQRRVGRDGHTFMMPKLRTMTVDADERKGDLLHLNERAGGPLFKLADDPRVTRVGRLLRATSIDELPQLVSVLRGQMSLVGPRPALPAEVESFDARLATRHRVRPGLTGLWQVEQRDNGAFDAYRRLDLFYVENWSLVLDLTILLHTVPAVLARSTRSLRRSRAGIVSAPARFASTEPATVDNPSPPELVAS